MNCADIRRQPVKLEALVLPKHTRRWRLLIWACPTSLQVFNVQPNRLVRPKLPSSSRMLIISDKAAAARLQDSASAIVDVVALQFG